MRARVVVALTAALVVVGGAVMIGAGHLVPVLASARSENNGGPGELVALGGLRLIAGNPVLVHMGEPVRVPVDVICTTDRGTCSADLSMDVSDGTTSSRATVPDANGVVRFDLAVPMARAVAAGGRSIAFRLTASDELGRQAALPSSASSVVRAYVTDELQLLAVPAVPFGSAVSGETVLFLPWGTGPLRAGFAPGLESLPAGPASFEVDASGRIFLLDRLQSRLAVFGAGRLNRETTLEAPDPTDIAVTASGECLVLSGRFGAAATVRTVDQTGVLGPSVVVGEGLPSQLRAVGERAFAKLLPLDAWTEVGGRVATPTTGLPLADGRELLSVVRPEDDAVRLGLVSGGRVVDAIELRFAARVGELALAATMDDGAYLAVVRVARDGTNAADQYLVVRVSAARAVSTFPVASRAFAGPSPMSRFRLGADGNLYQLTSSPDGVRVQRFEIGGAS
jgi:hypothetical protein